MKKCCLPGNDSAFTKDEFAPTTACMKTNKQALRCPNMGKCQSMRCTAKWFDMKLLSEIRVKEEAGDSPRIPDLLVQV